MTHISKSIVFRLATLLTFIALAILIWFLVLSIPANASTPEPKDLAVVDAETDAAQYNALHWGVMGAAAPVVSTSAGIAACLHIHPWAGAACMYGVPAIVLRGGAHL